MDGSRSDDARLEIRRLIPIHPLRRHFRRSRSARLTFSSESCSVPVTGGPPGSLARLPSETQFRSERFQVCPYPTPAATIHPTQTRPRVLAIANTQRG